MKLKEFTCTGCGSIDLKTGGTCGHLCNPCKVSRGLAPGMTPQQEAHLAVAKARAHGLLASPRSFSCVDCGGPAIEYDHRDYAKPLSVEPTCRRCNLRRGPALNKG